MQPKKYFENIRISPKSPLLKYLNVEPGDYYGQFDFSVGKLFLKNKKEKNNNGERLELTVTLEQLVVILAMAGRVEGDKFTPQDITTMVEVARKSHFSSKQKGFIAHHIIPIEVCRSSKLTLWAKQRCGFDENSKINRLLLPVHFHKGNHQDYSDLVLDILEDEWSDIVRDGVEHDCEAIKEVLIKVTAYLRDKISEWRASGVCSINDV